MRIDVSNLKKCFGENTAVNIGEYHIGDGELVGLVGNNGAGKTTLFRLLLDLIKADDGRVTLGFQGEGESEGTPEMLVDPSKSEDWKNYTGSYIDEGFLIDFLTPEEYFAFIGKVCGISKEEVEERVKTYEPLMAGEILGHKKLIRDLSAGNKQKVGIIAALLNHPQLVILDEPFNFLDPTSQNVLKKILTEYNKSTGSTIIISSHNLAHTIDICPRITLLEHGVIVKDLENNNHDAAKELEDYFNKPQSFSETNDEKATSGEESLLKDDALTETTTEKE